MFIDKQSVQKVDLYTKTLRNIAALSRLFSENTTPFIHYRALENAFCFAFNAVNHARLDSSIDASKVTVGLGLKTFIMNSNSSYQKIAEFNADRYKYDSKDLRKKIETIAELRNYRLDISRRMHGVDTLMYHCITRRPEELNIIEEDMNEIDISNIDGVSSNMNSCYFHDGKSEYTFNESKSTLYKRFHLPSKVVRIHVAFVHDPFEMINSLYRERKGGYGDEMGRYWRKVYLPLFSDRGKRHVPERSGLNQWNARGRSRDPNELYIPIPRWIHNRFPSYFPPRDTDFSLNLPNGRVISAKVCQDNNKALMSNPNHELGKWLLRDVLQLPEGRLVTHQDLESIGLDTVAIYKIDNNHYEIGFCKIGTYDEFFIEQNV